MQYEESDIKFDITREGGRISGLRLIGLGETLAEAFCISFITAYSRKKGRIEIKGGKIIFRHDGIATEDAEERFGVWGNSSGGEFSVNIEASDAAALSDLLGQKGDYQNTTPVVELYSKWGRGFTLCAKPN